MAGPSDYLVQQERRRLEQLSRAQARQQFSDRVARAFQLQHLNREEFVAALAFNAELATEMRKQAQAKGQPDIWSAR